MEVARAHIFREIDVLEEWLGLGRPALRRTRPWLAATLVLGLLFLLGQAAAWKQLTAQGFAFDRWATPASYFFYIITGLHAAHLVLGILALLSVSPRWAGLSESSPARSPSTLLHGTGTRWGWPGWCSLPC